MKQKLIRAVAKVAGAVAVVVFAAWLAIAQPSWRGNPASGAAADPEKLREHVTTLSERFHPRDWQHRDNLDRCADYIARQFEAAGATVEFQAVTVGKQEYRNVIGRFAAGKGPGIVVGAHYDAFGELPGADDNASGIAALIELACLLGRGAPAHAVELVAYVLEEPPFFRTELMGSAVHAQRLAGDPAGVRGVIVLEMVGCFKDERGSQTYPVPLLRLLYPSRANFIGVVGRWDQGDWIRTVKAGMQGTAGLPVYSIRAPSIVPGVDFSDHLNYWPHGFKAVMLTDTAFYRNKAYHTAGDRPDTLDYGRMAKVVVAVYEAIRSM
jgi:Zn-dependent M28 family amino/carboxypeptidase